MGTRRRWVARATVVSACALSVPLAVTPAAHAGCDPEGGLFTGVTGELCRLTTGLSVDLTDGVDKATGGTLNPVTDGLDDTVGKAGEHVGDLGPKLDRDRRRPRDPAPSPDPSDRGKPPPCVPGLLSSPCDGGDRPDEPGRKDPGGRKRDDGPAAPPGRRGPADPAKNLEALPGHPHAATLGRPATPLIGVPFLWPGHGLEGLWAGGDGRVRGHGPDPAEGALMAALVLSAILAARIVSIRRRRAGAHSSMPFEPV